MLAAAFNFSFIDLLKDDRLVRLLPCSENTPQPEGLQIGFVN